MGTQIPLKFSSVGVGVQGKTMAGEKIAVGVPDVFLAGCATAAALLAAGCVLPSPPAERTTTITRYLTQPPDAAQPVPASPAPVTSTAPQGAPVTMATDGTYLVGADVQPGSYKSAPTHANNYPFCTWNRLKDLSGSLQSNIAIENSPGTTFVTIAPNDLAFKTLSCQPWEKVG